MGVNFPLKNKLLNNKGFTLIEVVIAMAVIAIGMFAMMSLVITVTKGTAHSRKVTTATNIAENAMEDLKRRGYANVVNVVNGVNGVYGTGTVANYYYWEATGTATANIGTITVNVYWSPGTLTSTHNVQLQTILTP